jgi:formylglycine-generating enzyme required for sulfatase activity
MTIFSDATKLAALPLDERLARSWRILTAIESAHEFSVSLDFAVERGFVDAEFAPQLLGLPEAKAPSRYWVNPIDGSEMVWIPPGPFLIGDEQRRVTAHGFFLARYPVTNGQFDRYLTAMRLENNSQVEEFLRTRNAFAYPPDRARYPVTHVSYLDALGYCHWASMMLPSEWLWEKAARGIDARTYPWGERKPYFTERGGRTSQRLAQVRETETCAVDKFAEVRSPYGCEQLVGNISEWCEPDDEFWESRQFTIVPQLMPATNLEQAAVRGSCFKRRSLSRMRSSHRRRLSVNRRNDWVGFRPAFYPPVHRVVHAPSD